MDPSGERSPHGPVEEGVSRVHVDGDAAARMNHMQGQLQEMGFRPEAIRRVLMEEHRRGRRPSVTRAVEQLTNMSDF